MFPSRPSPALSIAEMYICHQDAEMAAIRGYADAFKLYDIAVKLVFLLFVFTQHADFFRLQSD